MASPTWWTWVWVDSGSWWWTGRPGVLWFMGSQRVGHDWATGLNWTELGVENGKPLQYSCWRSPWTEDPGKAPTVYRVAKSWTQLTDWSCMQAPCPDYLCMLKIHVWDGKFSKTHSDLFHVNALGNFINKDSVWYGILKYGPEFLWSFPT